MKNINRILKIGLVILACMFLQGCGFILKPSFERIVTGPDQSVEIHIPFTVDSSDMGMEIKFMSGQLKISPGAVDSLVSGSATFNAEALQPYDF